MEESKSKGVCGFGGFLDVAGLPIGLILATPLTICLVVIGRPWSG